MKCLLQKKINSIHRRKQQQLKIFIRNAPISPLILVLWKKPIMYYVIPASFGWSDLGTWNSAWENTEKDYFENAVSGKNVVMVDAKNCMVHVPNNKLVLLQGLEDYIVVDTKDVLLICKRDKEQEIKDYVAEVKRNKGDKYL